MIYSLFYTLAMLLAAPLLLLRAGTRRKYLHSAAARLGFGEPLNPECKPAIWLHAVSVGEALAVKSLVAELRSRLPGFLIFVSTTTATGREVAEKNLDADGFFYFPFDWKFAMRRALRSTGACLCIVMETELWPNFVRTLARRKLPLVLANGRLSDRSFRSYRRFRWFFGPLLRRYAAICAQSETDAGRFRALGACAAAVRKTGNLKFERGQFESDPEIVEGLRRTIAMQEGDKLIIAGSTHAGEEEALLSAFRRIRELHRGWRLVIAPRRPERFDEVAALLGAGGWDFSRFTDLKREPRRTKIVLVDTIGVLRPLYRLGAVAFIGGSLIPHGGQNPLEACAAGVPVLFGHHMSNFREIAEQVLATGAGRQVADAEELETALAGLVSDEPARERMSRAALRVIEENQQALPGTIEAVRRALALRGSYVVPPLVLSILARIHHSAAGMIRGEPKRRLARAQKLKTPTISVGGLSFGGSGKSPMVALLAGEFLRRGMRVAVLTRGYKGRGPRPMVVSDGREVLAGAETAGDEPVMLAHSLPGLIVVRDSKRLRGGRLAEERFAPDLFILDDGFQHRALGRDFNLLMLDADSVTGGGMPCHQLREPLRFAAAADAIILLARSEAHLSEARSTLTPIIGDLPVFPASHKAADCVRFGSGESVPQADLAGLKPLAFCGIAVPERFALTLSELGADPTALLPFPDHHRYTTADLARIRDFWRRSGADAMITTAKDAQRLHATPSSSAEWSNLLVLSVKLEIDRKEELLGLIENSLKR
jgi:3-deoxy-D-manno-octulosonic-acid transferase